MVGRSSRVRQLFCIRVAKEASAGRERSLLLVVLLDHVGELAAGFRSRSRSTGRDLPLAICETSSAEPAPACLGGTTRMSPIGNGDSLYLRRIVQIDRRVAT